MTARILEGVPYAILLLVLIDAARTYPSLPRTIPRHFGFRGEPQAYGARWLVFLPPLIVLPAFALASWGVRHPTRPPQSDLVPLFFWIFLSETALLVAVITRSWIAVALGKRQRLNFKGYLIVVAAIVATLVVGTRLG